MKVTETELPGVILLEPKMFGDERGFFVELWRENNYKNLGIADNFVQDNVSRSCRGVLRGLHFQWPNPQGKLVSVLEGEVFDVAVDIRKDSPTFGKWVGFVLSQKNFKQLYVPQGFAHGFLVLSDMATFTYKCTNYYSPKDESSILWNDPQINVEWPKIDNIILSEKDKNARLLKDVILPG